MGRSSRFSPEVRERAVRMVEEHREAHASAWAVLQSVAPKLGCTAETLRKWVRQAQRDAGHRPGLRVHRSGHQGERIAQAPHQHDLAVIRPRRAGTYHAAHCQKYLATGFDVIRGSPTSVSQGSSPIRVLSSEPAVDQPHHPAVHRVDEPPPADPNPIPLRALFDVVGIASILRVILESGQYFRIVVDQSRMPRAELLELALKRRGDSDDKRQRHPRRRRPAVAWVFLSSARRA